MIEPSMSLVLHGGRGDGEEGRDWGGISGKLSLPGARCGPADGRESKGCPSPGLTLWVIPLAHLWAAGTHPPFPQSDEPHKAAPICPRPSVVFLRLFANCGEDQPLRVPPVGCWTILFL